MSPADQSRQNYAQSRRAHWDGLARRMVSPRWSRFYHGRLTRVYATLVPPGARVLEVGCGRGDLLAALAPGRGVGVDFSPAMVELARREHPELTFVEADAHGLDLGEQFDYVVLNDLVNDLWDVQEVLEAVRRHCHQRTRLVMNFYSRLWELPLSSVRATGLAQPMLEQNWLAASDVANLLDLAGFEVIRRSSEVLWPLGGRIMDLICNRVLARLWPLNHLAMTNLIVARKRPERAQRPPLVSVVVPARNEAGNIAAIIDRTPQMGAGTELIFVEGHSSDDTYAAIEREMGRWPGGRIKLLRQTGRGKGDAVRLGFAQASGEALMILDADLTVPPEDLPRFLEALVSGRGEFVNGVRLVYPMERQAMRFFNLMGNKFFSLAFTWLLGQPIKDSLCGTKVLWREDYQAIAANRAWFGDFDPFGDFDLLFGAARLGLKIIDLPVRYRERTYGETNIQRWRHGWLLLRMVAFAARRIKFV